MKDSWISVKDRIPENENDVLVYTSDGDFDIAYYSKLSHEWITYVNDGTHIIVTHWQYFETPN